MTFVRNFFFLLLPIFYVIAGAYHFIDPEFYLPVMPDYILFPKFANYAAGVLEIILGVAFLFPSSRRFACLGIVLLLIQFIPVHIDFILRGSCIEGMICVPEWMGYARLLLVHPLLIFWALFFRNSETEISFLTK